MRKRSLTLMLSAGMLACNGTSLLTDTAFPENLPRITGAQEFNVELPRRNNSIAVNPADYGMRPENEDNTSAFLAAIKAAKEQNASRMVLPNGTYRFTSSEWLEFNQFSDFEFDGQGSTLVFWKRRDVPSCMINIVDCRRVLFHNFKIDWDWEKDPIASLIEVETVSADRSSAVFRFTGYREFPQKEINISLIDRMEPDDTACMGEGSFWLAPNGEKKWLSGNRLQVSAGSFNQGRMPDQLQPGQRFRMSHYYGNFTGVAMSGNTDLTLRDIDLYSCPGFAFHAYGGQHHWQMRNVNIIRKPGTMRPITVSADHVHITKAKGFFKMEDCEMSFGNDDCFNVNDQSRTGIRGGDRLLKVTHPSGDFFIGDRVEFRKEDYSETGTVARITGLTPRENHLEMTFDAPLPGSDGERLLLFNREQGSENIILRNSYFHDNRAHGMRLQAKNITVENCRFVNNAMGIALTTGYTLNSWCEGYGAENIVLRNNTFAGINTGNIHPQEKSPAIYLGVFLKSDPSEEKTDYPVINRILFENNRFINSPGVIASVSSARDIVFRDNIIINDRPSSSNIAERGGITAGQCSNLYLTGNLWRKSSYAPAPALYPVAGSVGEIFLKNNRIIE